MTDTELANTEEIPTCDVTGRHVVVTGGGNGIGAALALEASKRGAQHVSVVDIAAEAAGEVATEIGNNATGYRCDVSSAADVEALADELSETHGVPGLVCANAGVIAPNAPLLDTPPEAAEWVLGVNVRGVVHAMQSFGRRMAAGSEPGWLMATASEHSFGVPHLHAALYTASKHAVLGLCDVLRQEVPDHIGVSALCPGLTTSNLWRAVEQRPDDLGGPAEGDPTAGAFMDHAGMDAQTVAGRAFDGLAAGRFLIPTHYNARAYAEARATEVREAFDRLGEIDTTDYDVNRLVAEMLAD